ncbi:MAG: AbrB/MazE/SpoVT family DNA-binding domain-containing protein [Acidiferrobacterales bacterium]
MESGIYWDVELPGLGRSEWTGVVREVIHLATPMLPACMGDPRSLIEMFGGKEGTVSSEPTETAAWSILLLLGMWHYVQRHQLLFTVTVATDIDSNPQKPRSLTAKNIASERSLFGLLGVDIDTLPDDNPFLKTASALGLYLPRANFSDAPTENCWF